MKDRCVETGATEIVDAILTVTSLEGVPDKVKENLVNRINLRYMSADDWIETHASGTLRKNKRLGFAWRDQYLAERVAYEFGWCFEVTPASRVKWGRPYTEGDCHAITESGWHIERYIESSIFPEDYYEAKYLDVEYADGSVKEGIGIVVRQTSAAWVGKEKLVFALVAEYSKKEEKWLEASNPF